MSFFGLTSLGPPTAFRQRHPATVPAAHDDNDGFAVSRSLTALNAANQGRIPERPTPPTLAQTTGMIYSGSTAAMSSTQQQQRGVGTSATAGTSFSSQQSAAAMAWEQKTGRVAPSSLRAQSRSTTLAAAGQESLSPNGGASRPVSGGAAAAAGNAGMPIPFSARQDRMPIGAHPAVQHRSAAELRSQKHKHQRAIYNPQDAFEQPLTLAHDYGWYAPAPWAETAKRPAKHCPETLYAAEMVKWGM